MADDQLIAVLWARDSAELMNRARNLIGSLQTPAPKPAHIQDWLKALCLSLLVETKHFWTTSQLELHVLLMWLHGSLLSVKFGKMVHFAAEKSRQRSGSQLTSSQLVPSVGLTWLVALGSFLSCSGNGNGNSWSHGSQFNKPPACTRGKNQRTLAPRADSHRV